MNKKLLAGLAFSAISMAELCLAQPFIEFAGQMADKDGKPITAAQDLVFKVFTGNMKKAARIISKKDVKPDKTGCYKLILDLDGLKNSRPVYVEVTNLDNAAYIHRVLCPIADTAAEEMSSKDAGAARELNDDGLFDLLREVVPAEGTAETAEDTTEEAAGHPVRSEERKDTTELKQEYFGKGHSAFASGNYSEAIDFFSRILELDPDHGESKKYISRAQAELSKQ